VVGKIVVVVVLGRTCKVAISLGLQVEAFLDLVAQGRREMSRNAKILAEPVLALSIQQIKSERQQSPGLQWSRARQIKGQPHPGLAF
jgi:hypothetical protein